jgi:cytochrome c-type biogenesis protein CcmF
VLFAFASFALASLFSEFWRGASAYRALSGAGPFASLTRVVSRNRRRYGGYIAHAGIAVLFIAVAASSSFQTSRDLRLLPGESAEVEDYTVTYVEPTQSISAEEQRLTLGAVVDVDRDGEQFLTLTPSRNYYSAASTGTVAGFFEGEATSEVGQSGGVLEDLWTAMRPDLRRLEPLIRAVDRRLARTLPEVGEGGPTPEQVEAMRAYTDRQGAAIASLAQLYVAGQIPVDFRVNVNPLVIWIWVGGVIGVGGGLIAVWPAPEARRRRVSDVYAARLARELERSGA